jgi:hypothetical protein
MHLIASLTGQTIFLHVHFLLLELHANVTGINILTIHNIIYCKNNIYVFSKILDNHWLLFVMLRGPDFFVLTVCFVICQVEVLST